MQYLMFVVGIVVPIILLTLFFKKKIYLSYNKYICSAIIAVLIALVLEVFTFNFNSFENTRSDKMTVSADIKTSEVKSDGYLSPELYGSITKSASTEKNIYTLEMQGVDAKVNNIDVIPDSNDKAIGCKVYYSDEAVNKYTESGDESVIVPSMKSTGHMHPHFAGKCRNLKIELKTDLNSEINSIQVKLNYPAKFSFDIFRVLLVAAICFMGFVIYFTRGKGCLQFNRNSNRQFAAIMGLVVVEIVFTVFLSIAGNLQFNENGKIQSINFQDTQDPYQELTLAITKGKVDLNSLNPETEIQEMRDIKELQKLQNPYDCSQRDGLTYKWDRAFYNGKYYCYFGIVPALVFYLPYYLVTGHMLKTKILALLLVVIIEMLMAALVYAIASQYKKRLNLWVVMAAILGFTNVSMVLFCINGSKFYEIAAASALACALAGLNFIVRAFDNKKMTVGSLCAGAAFMALSVGCRPNFILVSFVAACLMLNGLAKKGGYVASGNNKIKTYLSCVFSKSNITAILAIIVPYVVVGLGLMYYNYIRFDSPFEFGAKYQLTVFDTGYYGMTDFGKIPLMIARALLIPPTISATFPYVNAVSESSNYLGYYYGMSYMGVLAQPIMWTVILLGWSMKRGIKDMGHKAFVMLSVIVGILMCYVTTAMGGTSLRYSVDFAWLFFIPVIYIVFDMYDRGRNRKITKYILVLVGILTVATVMINVLLCISPTWSSISRKVPEIFYRIEEMVVFWK